MILHVVAVGRVRQVALREACDEYATRVRRHLRLEVWEVPERSSRGRPPAEVRRAESEALRRAAPSDARLFAVTRPGETLSSTGFATRLAGWMRDGRDVALVLGGAYGLDQRALGTVEGRLSLSALTLPHELARLVLLEQIYRAGTILRGEPYHKGQDDSAAGGGRRTQR